MANNGEEALLRLENSRYDVVLMDLEMPGRSDFNEVANATVMDGITTIRHIREAETFGSRQLVMALTGNARQAQVDQALEAGMDEGDLRCGYWLIPISHH